MFASRLSIAHSQTANASMRVRLLAEQFGRRHNSGAQSASSGSNWAYLAAAGALGAGGYYYYSTQGSAGAAVAHNKNYPPAMDEQEFRPFRLREVKPLTHNVARFRFDLPHADQSLGLPTCSFLLTRTKGDNGKDVVRPYTPSSRERDLGYFDLVVKDYPQGVMSSHIHSLKPGDQLDVKGPIKKYQFDTPNLHKQVALIAGGSGLTPMLQIMHKVLEGPEDQTKVTFLFGNLSERDVFMKEEIDKYASQFPDRVKVKYIVDKAADPKSWAAQGGLEGHMTKDLLKQHLPPPSAENIKIFVCGPPGMMKAISGNKAPDYSQGELDGALKALGYNKDQVFKF